MSVQGGRRALFVPFFFVAFQRHVTHQAVTSVTRSGREADREDTMAAKDARRASERDDATYIPGVHPKIAILNAVQHIERLLWHAGSVFLPTA